MNNVVRQCLIAHELYVMEMRGRRRKEEEGLQRKRDHLSNDRLALANHKETNCTALLALSLPNQNT